MDEWSESVWVAVSLIIMSIVILFSLNTMQVAHEITNTIDQQEAVTTKMKEFRTYNAYDHTTVYSQDVVSLILETRGNPYIKVTAGSAIYYWQNNKAVATTYHIPVQKATEYSSTAILTKLNINKVYKAELIKGGNGEVLGVSFVETNP